MKEIKLTQGKVALVDDDDFEYLNQWKWYAHKKPNTFYAIRNPHVKMHRLIMGVTDPKILVDHCDLDGLNCQKQNLRIATKSQNGANRISVKNGTSKYLGVHFDYSRNKWVAALTKNYKKAYSKRFNSEHEAALAYNKKATELHGEFAKLNVIQ